MTDRDPCPNCGEVGEVSGKHHKALRCNNGSCKVKIYDDHHYSSFTDEVVDVRNYEGFIRNKENHVWTVDEENLEPKRGKGNSITAILQRMTGNKVKITIRELETPEEEDQENEDNDSEFDPFEQEKKHFDSYSQNTERE